MNRHNAGDFLKLVAALAFGKTIQAFRLQQNGKYAWEDFGPDEEVLFTCESDRYRIKPTT